MSYQPDRMRLPRVAGSCFLVVMGALGIVSVSREQDVSVVLSLTIFAAFLIVSSILITTIVSRIYRQHGISRPNFDLANLILLTILIALPFALANALWDHFQFSGVEKIQNDKTIVLLVMAGVAAFLLLPVFYITEALLSWGALLFLSRER